MLQWTWAELVYFNAGQHALERERYAMQLTIARAAREQKSYAQLLRLLT